MKLKILGTGCAKCKRLAEETSKAADNLGLDYELVKVTNIVDIMAHGVMMTPALVVDDQVAVAGKVPEQAELEDLLKKGGKK